MHASGQKSSENMIYRRIFPTDAWLASCEQQQILQVTFKILQMSVSPYFSPETDLNQV
jgi:hypothetical protein